MRSWVQLILIVGALVSSVSHGALYISPAEPVRGAVSTGHASPDYSNETKNSSGGGRAYAIGFGKDVPLSIVVDQVIPDGCWTVNFDDRVGDVRVSWSGGKPWDDVLDLALKDAGLKMVIRDKECAIGISRQSNIASALASRNPMVWFLREGKTLRENLIDWEEKSGWRIQWDLGIDYPVEHATTLVGPFEGQNGVFEQVINSFSGAEVPIKAIMHQQNKVIQIVQGGFYQGDAR